MLQEYLEYNLRGIITSICRFKVTKIAPFPTKYGNHSIFTVEGNSTFNMYLEQITAF